MRGLAACRIAQQFCNTQENPWRDFHLPCQPVKSHGRRLSNTEICLANLRSLQKSMEGFLKDHTPDWSGGRVACNPLPFPQGNGARRRGTTILATKFRAKRVTKGLCSRLQPRNEWQSKKNYRPKKYRLNYNLSSQLKFLKKFPPKNF